MKLLLWQQAIRNSSTFLMSDSVVVKGGKKVCINVYICINIYSHCCTCWQWFCRCCLATCTRAGNAIFTALEQSQEAIEITSEDRVIQVGLSLTPLPLCTPFVWYFFFPLSWFNSNSCLVIPDLGCISCGPHSSECLFLKHQSTLACVITVYFTHEVHGLSSLKQANKYSSFS